MGHVQGEDLVSDRKEQEDTRSGEDLPESDILGVPS